MTGGSASRTCVRRPPPGGVVANYAEVVALRHEAGRVSGAELRDRLSGETLSVEARAVVNATGPWIDSLRALEDPAAPPLARLSKGVHLLLDLDRPWSAALTIPHDPVRVTFAYPWQGMLLLGTTDTLYEGDPSELRVEPADVARVLDEASVGVEREVLDPGRVRASFAGLRVLPGLSGETLTARRETQYVFGRGGMLTVAGGKLTTYRRIALAALDRLRPELGLPRFDQRPLPLPGAGDLEDVGGRIAHGFPELDPATRSHLLHLYGSLAEEMLAPALLEPSLLEPIHPDAPDVLAQIAYADEQEWAVSVEDVVWRRTDARLPRSGRCGRRSRRGRPPLPGQSQRSAQRNGVLMWFGISSNQSSGSCSFETHVSVCGSRTRKRERKSTLVGSPTISTVPSSRSEAVATVWTGRSPNRSRSSIRIYGAAGGALPGRSLTARKPSLIALCV